MKYVHGQILVSSLFALYHMARAVSGDCKRDRIFQHLKDGDERSLSPEELVADSFEKSKRHIHIDQ